uniref:Uncharacterized protein n=1 Tax=Oryza rufipogon TaxID=4529 RepID=A0A0E0QXS2_ORYRU
MQAAAESESDRREGKRKTRRGTDPSPNQSRVALFGRQISNPGQELIQARIEWIRDFITNQSGFALLRSLWQQSINIWEYQLIIRCSHSKEILRLNYPELKKKMVLFQEQM